MTSSLLTLLFGLVGVAMGTAAVWSVLTHGTSLALGILCILAGAAIVPFAGRREDGLGPETLPDASALLPGEEKRERKRTHNHASRSRAARALIIGAGDVGRALAGQLEADGRYQVVGFIDENEIDPLGGKDRQILGPRWATSEIIRRYRVDEVFVAYAPTWQQELVEELARGGNLVKMQVVPSFYESMLCTRRMKSRGDVALVPLAISSVRPSDHIKRVFDLIASGLGLILLLPLMAMLTVLIKLTSPGPALFAQERVGRSGKTFTLYKFRTMRVDAEERTGPVLSAGKADNRLTPIGKWLRLFRLDELPQLLNVLCGQMSLVGPRPERPVFVAQFEARNPVYARRHEVRPGITGMAQLHAGYHTDARDKLRFDLFYVAHRSLWLDLSILARTVLYMVVRPDGR